MKKFFRFFIGTTFFLLTGCFVETPHQTIVRFMNDSKQASAAYRALSRQSQPGARHDAAVFGAQANEEAYGYFRELAGFTETLDCHAFLKAAENIRGGLEANGLIQTTPLLNQKSLHANHTFQTGEVTASEIDACRATLGVGR